MKYAKSNVLILVVAGCAFLLLGMAAAKSQSEDSFKEIIGDTKAVKVDFSQEDIHLFIAPHVKDDEKLFNDYSRVESISRDYLVIRGRNLRKNRTGWYRRAIRIEAIKSVSLSGKDKKSVSSFSNRTQKAAQ